MTNPTWLDYMARLDPVDHQQLSGREDLNSHPATAVGYAPNAEGPIATSTTVQAAIDALAVVASSDVDHQDLENRKADDCHPASAISFKKTIDNGSPDDAPYLINNVGDALGYLFSNVTKDHKDLINRDSPKQHKAEAITVDLAGPLSTSTDGNTVQSAFAKLESLMNVTVSIYEKNGITTLTSDGSVDIIVNANNFIFVTIELSINGATFEMVDSRVVLDTNNGTAEFNLWVFSSGTDDNDIFTYRARVFGALCSAISNQITVTRIAG